MITDALISAQVRTIGFYYKFSSDVYCNSMKIYLTVVHCSPKNGMFMTENFWQFITKSKSYCCLRQKAACLWAGSTMLFL